jgi:putative peptidoglycan lipid II flippase
MGEKSKVTKAAGQISMATTASRILGFIRDVILAKIFGATGMTDAFFVAYRIPNLLRELFAEGAVSAGFVPVFTEYLSKEGREEAGRLAGVVFAFLLSVLIVVCFAGIVFAPSIASVAASGFLKEPVKFDLTVKLMRIMFPFLLFISLAALVMGILNSLRSFFMPALAPAFFNVAIIASALLLAPRFQVPILAIGIGVTAGGILQYGVQIRELRRRGFRIMPAFRFSHPGLKRIIILVLPVVAAIGATQINVLISNIFATYLPDGSATYLYYGIRLVLLPIGIFGVAMAMAVLPSMSEQAVAGDIDALRDTFSFSLRLVFFLSIPAMTGLVALAGPIINLLYQRGEFTHEAAEGTVTALLYYSAGLWAFVGSKVARAPFYSMQDTKTPLIVAIFSVLTNVVFSLLLIGPMKHGGLALSLSIAASVNFIMLFLLLRAKLGRIDGRNILRSSVKICVASLVMGGAGRFLVRGDMWTASGMVIQKAGQLSAVIALCIALYLLMMRLMKSDELRYLLKMRGNKG